VLGRYEDRPLVARVGLLLLRRLNNGTDAD